ncbi:DNA primase [Serratia fonticola]|jgi:antirestriction protein ArdC|uniref:ArdC family protein n=1 Tax=Serratia fonticola TaxID=47917 RepID=UPI000466CB30|nr:zincin-like metallopeptidase domain-containing protein [Serratia fonticola]AKG68254.1 DNA primase [Serratia fonticola]CAI1524970.1 DNA primase TraC [Serratia fonticola]
MTTKQPRQKATSRSRHQDKVDLFQVVTDKIIAVLEKGTSPWRKPWRTVAGGMSGLPANAITGRAYSGINVLLLWIDAADKGFTSHRWLTFKQAQDAGGNVRKGEKSTLVTLFKPFEKKETDEQGRPMFDEQGNAVVSQRNFMTSFHLFNVEQCENLPEKLLTPVSVAGDTEETPEQHDIERIQRAEQVVACSGVPVVHRHQDQAFYSPRADRITVPEAVQFNSPADYYSTLLHELVHSTGHISRLAREGITSSSRRFGEPVYAFEELVAEIGSAFLCAEVGIQGDVQHESYIASWLKALKEDKKVIFQASRFAREAFEYLILREQALAAA